MTPAADLSEYETPAAAVYSDSDPEENWAQAIQEGVRQGLKEAGFKSKPEAEVTKLEQFSYTPHITLKYIGVEDPMPVQRIAPIPVKFGKLTLCIGGAKKEFELTGTQVAKGGPGSGPHAGSGLPSAANKSDDTWEVSGTITKLDKAKQYVFGWASIVEIGGKKITDTQGDIISPETIEQTAYDFVLYARKGGEMHEHDKDGEVKVRSHLIESVIFTEEKQKAMLQSLHDQGITDAVFDLGCCGWWVGFFVESKDTWAKVESGELKAFSVGGRGKRDKVE